MLLAAQSVRSRMPANHVQHACPLLAGAICLCLVVGCAGRRQFTNESCGTDDRPSLGPTESTLSQKLDIRPPPAAANSDAPSAIYAAFSGDVGTTDERPADHTPGITTPPTSDAADTSAALKSIQVSWSPGGPMPAVAGFRGERAEGLPAPPAAAERRTLSLSGAIDTALLQNSDVVSARAAAPVAVAARGVAATYPWNPTVQVGAFPYTRDLAGNLLAVKNQVALTQTLELAHQPRYRLQTASAQLNQERAKIAQVEWTAVAAAMRSYFDLMYKQGSLDLARESAELGKNTAGAVNRRFTAGLASPAERITSNVAARRSQRRAELAEADYRTARKTLRDVLNSPPEESVTPSESLGAYRWLPVLTGLGQSAAPLKGVQTPDVSSDQLTQLTATRPDVEAARYGASAARANLDLARANQIPNVSTGPSYERDESGTLFVGLTAQMDLPVWNSGRPLVRQRNMELQQQLITWRQSESRAATEARTAIERYEQIRQLWLATSVDQSVGKRELTSISDAFEKGQATITEVLSTQDNLIQERQANLDLLNQLSQAAVDVVAALAIDPELVIEAPSAAVPGPAMQP